MAADAKAAAERAALVDLSAPPDDFGPAIPLMSVQAHGPIDCVGACANQNSARIQPGGGKSPVLYRIDLLPKMNAVRVYSFQAFAREMLQTPEVMLPMTYVKTYKFLHAQDWYDERIAWIRDGGPAARGRAPEPEPPFEPDVESDPDDLGDVDLDE